MFLTSDEGLAAGVVDLFSPRWKNGAGERAQARSVTDRAGAARLASCGRDRLRDNAAANARRMWLVVSTTRGAIFKKRRRSVLHTAAYWLMLTVANSALANSRALGMASRARAAVWRSPIKSVSIEGELCLMQLDQILGLAARAIQAVVDPLGRADIEARDDEADVEAEHRRLNTGNGAPFAIPGLCLVARLSIAAQKAVLDGASRADMPYQAAQIGTHLDAARRLAGAAARPPRAGSSPCRRRGSADIRHNER